MVPAELPLPYSSSHLLACCRSAVPSIPRPVASRNAPLSNSGTMAALLPQLSSRTSVARAGKAALPLLPAASELRPRTAAHPAGNAQQARASPAPSFAR